MIRERESPARSLRCPWCQGEGPGERWVTCERDNTPIHAACLAEFGICPICREPVQEASSVTSRATRRQVQASEALSSDSGRRVIRIVPQELNPSSPFPLPAEVQAWEARVRETYASPLSNLSFVAGLITCTIGAAAIVALASPCFALLPPIAAGGYAALLWASRGRPRRSSLASPSDGSDGVAIVDRIVQGDVHALQLLDAHAAAVAAADRRLSDLERVERDRLAHHRSHLEARVPIEDAQRIRGIGSGITETLRAHGIASLFDLLRRGAAGVYGIGPKRAHLLSTWASDRSAAIDRLLRAGNFAGRADLDRAFEAQLVPVRERAASEVRGANAIRSNLIRWTEERSNLEEQLAALRRSVA